MIDVMIGYDDRNKIAHAARVRQRGKISNPKGRPALDKVVIDYKYMDEISVSIGQRPNYLKLQIDQYISSNFPQYNNSTYLIRINY